MQLIGMIVFIFCGILFYQQKSLRAQSIACDEKIVQLKQEIAKEKQQSKEMEKQKAYQKTKQYIEDLARQKFGLVYPGEFILKPEE